MPIGIVRLWIATRLEIPEIIEIVHHELGEEESESEREAFDP